MFTSSQRQNEGFLRSLIVVFVMVTCIRVWLGPVPLLSSAEAQLPDSALQRIKLLEATQRTNELLAEIKHLLADGTLNVRIDGADNTSADNKAPRKGG